MSIIIVFDKNSIAKKNKIKTLPDQTHNNSAI